MSLYIANLLAAVEPVVHTTGLSAAFYTAMVVYCVAAVLYVGAFTNTERLTALARWVLLVAFVAHGTDIGWRGVQHVHPGTSVREALGFLSWLMVGGYLIASLRYKLHMLGAFVAPIGLIILATARLSPSGDAPEGLSLLGRVHITLATLGVAIFALATAVAAIYLLGERNLKNKQFDGLLFRRGIALESLDVLAHRLVLIGFPIFTVAVMLGVIWVSQRHAAFNRPEYPLAFITWVSFASLIVARTTHGWRGRRAALLTMLGFAAAVVVFGIYFARRAVGG